MKKLQIGAGVAAAAVVASALLLSRKEKVPQESQEISQAVSTSPELPELPDVMIREQGEVSTWHVVNVKSETSLLPEYTGDQLDLAIETSLHGYFDANLILEEATKYLDQPLVSKVDMEHWDESVFAFSLGKEAHLLVDRVPFERDGKTYKAYTLRVERATKEDPWFVAGLPRENSRIDIAISMDSEYRAAQLTMMTDLHIALGKARDLGIDAYHGIYISGAMFSLVLDGKSEPICKFLGIKDGQPQQPYDFPGPNMLRGELAIRKDLLDVFRDKMISLISKLEEK